MLTGVSYFCFFDRADIVLATSLLANTIHNLHLSNLSSIRRIETLRQGHQLSPSPKYRYGKCNKFLVNATCAEHASSPTLMILTLSSNQLKVDYYILQGHFLGHSKQQLHHISFSHIEARVAFG